MGVQQNPNHDSRLYLQVDYRVALVFLILGGERGAIRLHVFSSETRYNRFEEYSNIGLITTLVYLLSSLSLNILIMVARG